MERKKNLSTLMNEIASSRGTIAETKVVHALCREENSCFFPEWFWGYNTSEENEDRFKGIDGWILTDVGKIPVQIKSSIRGEQKAKRNHPEIPVVVIRQHYSDEEVINRCFAAVAPLRNSYKRQRER